MGISKALHLIGVRLFVCRLWSLCLLGAGFPHGARCNCLRKGKTRHSASPSRADYNYSNHKLARFARSLRLTLALLAYSARWLRPALLRPGR